MNNKAIFKLDDLVLYRKEELITLSDEHFKRDLLNIIKSLELSDQLPSEFSQTDSLQSMLSHVSDASIESLQSNLQQELRRSICSCYNNAYSRDSVRERLLRRAMIVFLILQSIDAQCFDDEIFRMLTNELNSYGETSTSINGIRFASNNLSFLRKYEKRSIHPAIVPF